MMKQAKTNTPDEPHEPAAVLEAIPATALDGPAGNGLIAIFYGATHYPFELARQRELVEDYADTMDLNLVTEFHDRQQRQHGLSMLLDACQRGGVDYVITASWPTPNLTRAEADAVLDQLAVSGTHLVCLATGHQPGETGEIDQVGDSGQPSDVNQAGEAGNGTDARETSKAGDASVTSATSQANEQYGEVHHA